MVSEHVTVASYRYIDRLQTNKGPILQTSSEICGMLPGDYTKRLGDILFSLLPAGSITGAPKPRTMQIIAERKATNGDSIPESWAATPTDGWTAPS